MNTKSTFALALVTAALSATALAQQPGATGGAVLASEPGKAVVARARSSPPRSSARQGDADADAKGPKGNVVDIVAGDEVRNFDQIKLGDFVVARYVEALTLELRKTKADAGDLAVREEAAKAKPGERPAVAGATSDHRDCRCHRGRSGEEHDHAQGPKGQRSDAQCAEPRPVQGRQERRPGRGDLHRSARARRGAGAEAGGGEEEVSYVASRRDTWNA